MTIKVGYVNLVKRHALEVKSEFRSQKWKEICLWKNQVSPKGSLTSCEAFPYKPVYTYWPLTLLNEKSWVIRGDTPYVYPAELVAFNHAMFAICIPMQKYSKNVCCYKCLQFCKPRFFTSCYSIISLDHTHNNNSFAVVPDLWFLYLDTAPDL